MNAPQVAIIIGSESDLNALETSGMLGFLNKVGVRWALSIISADRNPEELTEYCWKKYNQGTAVFIGVAGMAAVLPGAISAALGGRKPVLGVGLSSTSIANTLAATFSQTCKPAGVPVMFMGLDKAGLHNAAIAACAIIALTDVHINKALDQVVVENRKPVQTDLKTSENKEGGS